MCIKHESSFSYARMISTFRALIEYINTVQALTDLIYEQIRKHCRWNPKNSFFAVFMRAKTALGEESRCGITGDTGTDSAWR